MALQTGDSRLQLLASGSGLDATLIRADGAARGKEAVRRFLTESSIPAFGADRPFSCGRMAIHTFHPSPHHRLPQFFSNFDHFHDRKSQAHPRARQEEAQQSPAHQRRKTRTPRRPPGGRRAGGVQHRAHDRPQHRRRHLQGPGAQHRTGPQGHVRGHRLREKRLPALLGRAARPGRNQGRAHRPRRAQGQEGWRQRRRRGRRRTQGRRPQGQTHLQGHPHALPRGQRGARAGHQRPHRHEGPAREHEHVAGGPLPRVHAVQRPERHLAQDRGPQGARAPAQDPARPGHPRRHGRHHPHGLRGPAGALPGARPGPAAGAVARHRGNDAREESPRVHVRAARPDRPHGARLPDRRGGQGGVRRRWRRSST